MYLMLPLKEETAAQAVVGSIVRVFRRLIKPMSREMSARGYALHSVCPQPSFFTSPKRAGACTWAQEAHVLIRHCKQSFQKVNNNHRSGHRRCAVLHKRWTSSDDDDEMNICRRSHGTDSIPDPITNRPTSDRVALQRTPPQNTPYHGYIRPYQQGFHTHKIKLPSTTYTVNSAATGLSPNSD